MTQRGRFQIRTLLAEQGEVKSYRGVDTLTGLPVLIYCFPGRPLAALSNLESDNIPGVLETSFDGKEGRIVVAYAPEYRPLDKPVEPEDVLPLLLDSITALKDAAYAGVTHGNLKPERFLRAEHHHLVEGYGVRWRPEPSPYTAPDALEEASYAGDVYAWAKSVSYLCGSHLPAEIRPLVKAALAETPQERPPAERLFEAMRALNDRETREGEAAWPLEDGAGHGDSGFVKSLPPGARYRDGLSAESLPPAPVVVPEEAHRSARAKSGSRRKLLLVVLLVGVALLALLALVRQRAFAVAIEPLVAASPEARFELGLEGERVFYLTVSGQKFSFPSHPTSPLRAIAHELSFTTKHENSTEQRALSHCSSLIADFLENCP